jgi:hypothetical protein
MEFTSDSKIAEYRVTGLQSKCTRDRMYFSFGDAKIGYCKLEEKLSYNREGLEERATTCRVGKVG